jgi:subtilisin family serine protease
LPQSAAPEQIDVKRILVSLLMVLINLAHSGSAPDAFARPAVLDAAVLSALVRSAPDQPLDVIVTLRDQAEVSQLDRSAVPAVLQRHAASTQSDLLAMLHARSADQVYAVTPLWIDNAIALSASREVIFDLARRTDVARIQLDEAFLMPTANADLNAVPSNLAAIGAPAAWQRGVTGRGVVVAVLDSGVDLLNADLAAKWRGGSNSWFDPYGEHDAPVDLTGHGTQVLGVILGGEDDGVPLGVAPGAQWIAAKIFNDRGRATTSAIHRALQWVLDPDGDPATDDAPQVVNNSWSAANAGCNSDFAADLRALRAAGILPVFAAGINQSVSPANLPEAFAVGAVTAEAVLLADSAHGPSNCLADGDVYPQLVAPGDNIHTTNHYGAFITASGTSLAAAHVSGALALLLSVTPHLSADEQVALLIETAVDLGESGPDNNFGHGRLDVAALIDRAAPITAPLPIMIAVISGLLLVAGAAIIISRRRYRPVVSDVKTARQVKERWQDLDS